MKRLSILLFLIFLSGCASITPYLNQPQELHEGEAVILSRLLDSASPLENFEAVREIAFRNNPDMNVLALEIISYHKGLGLLRNFPLSSGSKIYFGDYAGSAMSVCTYVSDLIRKINPESDPNMKVMIARFERLRLEISQGISDELSLLEDLNEEVRVLKSLHKDKSIEEKINRFFEKKGFSIASDGEKQEDKNEELLKKKLAEREKVVRRIYELCGLVKK